MVKRKFWPEIDEYALDIELFQNFWENISSTDLSGHLTAIEIEMLILLPKKQELKPKDALPWEKMKFIAFYDDLVFSKRYLEFAAEFLGIKDENFQSQQTQSKLSQTAEMNK